MVKLKQQKVGQRMSLQCNTYLCSCVKPTTLPTLLKLMRRIFFDFNKPYPILNLASLTPPLWQPLTHCMTLKRIDCATFVTGYSKLRQRSLTSTRYRSNVEIPGQPCTFSPWRILLLPLYKPANYYFYHAKSVKQAEKGFSFASGATLSFSLSLSLSY
jgi:hypothetical protein